MLHTGRNLGYGGGVNYGAGQTTGRVCFSFATLISCCSQELWARWLTALRKIRHSDSSVRRS